MKINGLFKQVWPCLCLVFFILFDAKAQTNKNNDQMLSLDTAVRAGKLANGFTYYIRHNEEPKNRAVIYLVNKVGSILEDEDQRGLAHFMEHMSFNGTAHFPHNDLVNYLQKVGVRFGADLNAYTNFNETVYQLPIPTDKSGLLDSALLIMHDWAQNATLDPLEIDKERGVVLEERRLRKGLGERVRMQEWPVTYNNSRYIERDPIGIDTVLRNFKRPAISRFYHDWYRPDLQALIIVGDVNADSLVNVIKNQFSDLKNPASERRRVQYDVPLLGKNQFITITDKEIISTSFSINFKARSDELKTTTDYRNEIIKNLFNQMVWSRYKELTRKPDGPLLGYNAGIYESPVTLNTFNIVGLAKPGLMEAAFKASYRELEQIERFGFAYTELARAKRAYLNSLEQALKEKNKIPSENYVSEYVDLFLKDIATPGILNECDLACQDLPSITTADLQALAQKFLGSNDRDIIIHAPDSTKNKLPSELQVNSWINEVKSEKILAYKDNFNDAPLLSTQPTACKIVSERQDENIGITTFLLSNGLKVVIKPSDFKNSEIQYYAFAPGGTSLADDADFQSASNAISLVIAGGLGNYNSDQLDKFLSDKQVRVRPYIGDRFEGVSGASSPKDLETALQMIYGYFTEIRKDSSRFKFEIESKRELLKSHSIVPEVIFRDSIITVLSNHNARQTPPTAEKINQINLDKAFSIYKKLFSDASNFTFVFVGNIDTAALKPLLKKYLASLPATNLHVQTRDLGIRIPKGIIKNTVYKGKELKSTVLLVYSGDFVSCRKNQLILDALKECLQIRLLQRLREDEGEVYSPGVFAHTAKYPSSRFDLMIQFGCAPGNVEKLVALTKDEIKKIIENGPLAENLEKWRAASIETIKTNLRRNDFWLNYIVAALQDDETPDDLTEYVKLRDEISLQDVKQAAIKYLNGKNVIQFSLLPENFVIK